ncbi:unnamed protein product [Ostreobium quekettii]|uniref:TFIIS N-terminal domain-containing protein n=1 Tax=Ostreobium quekettii TaxID=121088 RepID=A0A8S1ILN2_9CHLO|nr:unnamed protein product [Ostreobium quekettii]
MEDGPPGPPIFSGTSGKKENTCANCGTDSTAGIWRRGWDVEEGKSANLCNRCGLAFKQGKVTRAGQGSGPTTRKDPPRRPKPNVAVARSAQRQSAPDSIWPSSTSDTGPGTAAGAPGPTPSKDDPRGPASTDRCVPELPFDVVQAPGSSEYVSYSLTKDTLADGVRRVSFHMQDSQGLSTLAVVGLDPRGTGHFTYKSQSGLEPYLHVTNRTEVINWLATHGAKQQVSPANAVPSRPSQAQIVAEVVDTPPRPDLGGKYTSFEENHYKSKDGTHHREYYLVNGEGDRKLVISAHDGPRQDRRYEYRSTEEFGALSFRNATECERWLEYILGLRDTLPQGIRSKKREHSAAGEAVGTGPQAKRQSPQKLEDETALHKGKDIAAAYQANPDIYEWVISRPPDDVVGRFKQWAAKLSGIVTDEPPAGMEPNTNWTSTQEAIQIIQLIDSCETSLRLLETTRISRAMALLRSHKHDELASLARKVSIKWKKMADEALVIARRSLQQIYG